MSLFFKKKKTLWSLLKNSFPGGSAGKESTCNTGDLGLIPGLGRSPGEGNGYPLQYSGLENSMDCIVHGVTKSQTRLSDFHALAHLVKKVSFNVEVQSAETVVSFLSTISKIIFKRSSMLALGLLMNKMIYS